MMRLWPLAALALMAAFVLGYPLWVGLLVDAAAGQTRPCTVVPEGAAWCKEAHAHDGWVQFSLTVANEAGCCRWQRQPLTTGAHREDRLMCSATALPDCSAYEGALPDKTILVGGVTLTARP